MAGNNHQHDARRQQQKDSKADPQIPAPQRSDCRVKGTRPVFDQQFPRRRKPGRSAAPTKRRPWPAAELGLVGRFAPPSPESLFASRTAVGWRSAAAASGIRTEQTQPQVRRRQIGFRQRVVRFVKQLRIWSTRHDGDSIIRGILGRRKVTGDHRWKKLLVEDLRIEFDKRPRRRRHRRAQQDRENRIATRQRF